MRTNIARVLASLAIVFFLSSPILYAQGGRGGGGGGGGRGGFGGGGGGGGGGFGSGGFGGGGGSSGGNGSRIGNSGSGKSFGGGKQGGGQQGSGQQGSGQQGSGQQGSGQSSGGQGASGGQGGSGGQGSGLKSGGGWQSGGGFGIGNPPGRSGSGNITGGLNFGFQGNLGGHGSGGPGNPVMRSFSGGPGRFVGPGGPGPHGGSWGPGGPGFHPYGSWYHGDWRPGPGWAHPWHVGPVGWFSVGFVTGAIVWDAPWYWGYWPYYNPYYTEVIVIDGGTTIDYSRPIVVSTPPAPLPGSTTQTAADTQASQLLDAARVSFSSGDYTTALGLVNQAISRKPNDPVLHEFRGLILFATKQYKQAAATIYAVLSVGPGWDWATMSSFYPTTETYTSQLRALEQYRNANLNAADVRFLLAYHYMTCGHTDAAQTELKEAVRLNPKDQLSSQLLAGLSSSKDATTTATPPQPSQTAATAVPVTVAALVGNWQATRSTDESITFNLTAENTYAWKYVNKGKTQEFSGTFTLADNLLILKQEGNPTMIGQVSQLSPTQFNFKLAGNNPSDPGLTFSKK